MKAITTQEFGHEPIPFGSETDQVEFFPGLTTPVSDDVVILDQTHRDQLEVFAHDALLAFGPVNGELEPTKVQKEHGIPALITRVDCTIVDGDVRPFELEDRPAGLGIAHLLQMRHDDVGQADAIKEHFNQHCGDIPFVIVSGKRPYGTDDPAIFGKDRYHFRKDSTSIPEGLNGGPVLLRTVTGDLSSSLPYEHLVSRAVAPVVTEGDKSYLARLGLVHTVYSDLGLAVTGDNELVSQVLKPTTGSMSVDVSMFLSKHYKELHGDRGIVTESKFRKKLQALVERDGSALIQKFEPPIRIENAEGRSNMILRMIVLCRPLSGFVETEVIGGCYVARRENIVHGSTNAISGSVLVQ